jgi:HEAT repeat protein
MASDYPDHLPPKPQKFSPDDILPPVEPPSVTFLLQLFLIPLMIVSIIVGVWLLFSWLATASVDPQQMLQEIRQNREASWQRAVTLASMLDNPDSRYAELRKDPEFARELGEILTEELKTPLTDRKAHDQRLKVRYFLCRALGRMETPEAIPPLLEAAQLDRNVAEVDVRLGALESLALLASQLGPEVFQNNDKAMDVLLACSRASDSSTDKVEGQSADYRPHGEVRGAAAYALGVIGGERATDRLAEMLDDVYPNARYNAATGLARQGDVRAIPVLVEMLDPQNELVAASETAKENRDNQRIQVLKNAIQASVRLAEQQKSAPKLSDLREALNKLATTEISQLKDQAAQGAIQSLAKEAVAQLGATP